MEYWGEIYGKDFGLFGGADLDRTHLRYIYSWDELEENRCDSVALLFGVCDALGRQETAQRDRRDGFVLHASC